MSNWLIGVVTILYCGTTIDFCMKGNYGMALTFFGYSVANIGLIIATRGT